jgi:hypothetical protein
MTDILLQTKFYKYNKTTDIVTGDDICPYEIFVHFGNLLAKNFVSLLKDKRSLYPTVTNKCRSNFYGQF